jgi:uncharacterized membrane protein
MNESDLALRYRFPESAYHSAAIPHPVLISAFYSFRQRRVDIDFTIFWRIRAHALELYFYGPVLLEQTANTNTKWNEVLFDNHKSPRLHISLISAIGRRIRRNYAWIFVIQAASYSGKLLIHPTVIVGNSIRLASEVESGDALG